MCATVTQSIFETKAFHRLPDWTALAHFISKKKKTCVHVCEITVAQGPSVSNCHGTNTELLFGSLLIKALFFCSLHRVFSQKCGNLKCGRELVRVDKAHNGRIKRRRLSSLILWVIKKCRAHKHAKWRCIALNTDSLYRDGGVLKGWKLLWVFAWTDFWIKGAVCSFWEELLSSLTDFLKSERLNKQTDLKGQHRFILFN